MACSCRIWSYGTAKITSMIQSILYTIQTKSKLQKYSILSRQPLNRRIGHERGVVQKRLNEKCISILRRRAGGSDECPLIISSLSQLSQLSSQARYFGLQRITSSLLLSQLSRVPTFHFINRRQGAYNGVRVGEAARSVRWCNKVCSEDVALIVRARRSRRARTNCGDRFRGIQMCQMRLAADVGGLLRD